MNYEEAAVHYLQLISSETKLDKCTHLKLYKVMHYHTVSLNET